MPKTKKKLVLGIVIPVVVIVCLLAAGLLTFFVGILQPHKKRAVIIVPGLFASALYDADTGKAVWDPFDDIDLWLTDIIRHGALNYDTLIELALNDGFQQEINHLTANDGHGDGEGFLYKFTAINEDGTSKFNIKPYPPTTETRHKYGLMNAQKDIYDYFEETYGDTYDVILFNYDFRLDNRINGKNLEDFINENKYDEVILASHSNGGPVVASYLARSEENRKKVSLYLSYDAPYLGSVTALTTLENLERMINGVEDYVALLGLSDEVVQTAFHEQFLPLANMFTVYQLLPTYELLCTPHYYYLWSEDVHTPGEEPDTIYTETETPLLTMYNYETGKMDDYTFSSDKALYDFYCSRPWAHKNNDLNDELRAGMKDWLEYNRSFYVEDGGETKHVTELINTYYFCGIGHDTPHTAEYLDRSGELRCYLDNESEQGDGTVLLYSATAGTADYTRHIVIPFADHYDVVQYFNQYTRDVTEKIILSNLDWKQEIRLKWNKK